MGARDLHRPYLDSLTDEGLLEAIRTNAGESRLCSGCEEGCPYSPDCPAQEFLEVLVEEWEHRTKEPEGAVWKG